MTQAPVEPADQGEEEEEEVDSEQEDSTDQAIAAIAAIIAGLALASAAGSTAVAPVAPIKWAAILGPAAGAALTTYTIHSIGEMARSFPAGGRGGLRGPSAGMSGRADAIARRITPVVVDKAIIHADLTLRARAREWDANQDAAAIREQIETDTRVAARAMVLGAREPARFKAATELGAVYKVWRNRGDDRVRTTHGGLEGNRVPISSAFVSFTGATIRYPHDPLAPIEETANCRCRLSYIVPREA